MNALLLKAWKHLIIEICMGRLKTAMVGGRVRVMPKNSHGRPQPDKIARCSIGSHNSWLPLLLLLLQVHSPAADGMELCRWCSAGVPVSDPQACCCRIGRASSGQEEGGGCRWPTLPTTPVSCRRRSLHPGLPPSPHHQLVSKTKHPSKE